MHTNHTHDRAATSWVASANGHADFPIQNLPYAMFAESAGSPHPAWRSGVAIGNEVLDLAALHANKPFTGVAAAALEVAALASQTGGLNAFMALGRGAWSALRHALFALLRSDADAATQASVRACLLAQSAVRYKLPSSIANYTDFYTSIHHARNVGRISRPDAPPLTPNFQWLPIAYHGRASSVVVSGTPFHRPMGQAPGPSGTPVLGACARLDYELELGLFVGPGNARGSCVALGEAEDHMFGICLLNDWSARDIQFWEMAPLGPFSGKNFCTSVSPWVVTMEALAPFRLPFTRPADEPQPLPYLSAAGNNAGGALDIRLDVSIETAQQRAAGRPATRITHTSFKHQYWTFAQMLTQHTLGGCNLHAGDLLGSGTISGPTAGEEGAIIELTRDGREPVALGHGEERGFLHDGDAVILQGWCERAGAARIGFGQCRGEVLPVRAIVDNSIF